MTKILGKDLRIGDQVKVWWNPKSRYNIGDLPSNVDEIVKFDLPRPEMIPWYENRGFKDGIRFARFKFFRCGMTIDHSDYYDVINK